MVESQLGGVSHEKKFLGGNPLAESLNASPERYTRDTILGVTYSWRTNYGNCDRIFSDFKITPSKWRHMSLQYWMTSFWRSNFKTRENTIKCVKFVLHEYRIYRILSFVHLLKTRFEQFFKKSLNRVFKRYKKDKILWIPYSWRTKFIACDSNFPGFKIQPSKWRHPVLKGHMTSFWRCNFKIGKNPITISIIRSPRICYSQNCISRISLGRCI